MRPGKLNVVMDGQWGSVGKGKLAAWLAFNHDARVAVCDFQTNAGHTVIMDDGTKHVLQQLPVSAIKEDCELLINPGATITIPKLLEEIETHKAQNRLTIHPHATIVTDRCREYEKENLNRISSTLKGCGAALGMKAMRHPEVMLAKDAPELKPWIGDTTEKLWDACHRGQMILVEGAQGFDLSLNHGYTYPYVTSRDVTTASIINNCGVAPHLLGDVYGCIRTFPIRVGNSFDAEGKQIGTSGPYYDDQEELTWADMTEISGSPENLIEQTTVTKKVRRIFTFSNQQLRRFIKACGPDFLFINFVNYLDWSVYGKQLEMEMTERVIRFRNRVEYELEILNAELPAVPRAKIKFLGTGAKMSEMVVLP